MLGLHQFDAYRVANEFLALVVAVTRSLARGSADDADQLRRAAKSIVRNIAEGAGRRGTADNVKHYAIARGEAMECASSLDILRAETLLSDAVYAQGCTLLERLVAMLTKLTKKPDRAR